MSELSIHPNEFAYDNGLEIVEPADNELQIDLDRPEDVVFFKEQLKIVKQMFDVKRVSYTESRSGNKHAYVVLSDPLSFHQRLALQACLGSDRKRELLTFRNEKIGIRQAMFLYEVAQ